MPRKRPLEDLSGPGQRRRREQARQAKMCKAAGMFIRSTLEKGIEGLRNEFHRNPRIYDTAKCTVSGRNPKLNRYKYVGCHDHNRVHVFGANPDEYIHANYVGTERNPKRFICTQGPMETTCADFWRMVMQQNVESILMLCEFEEQNRPRCAKYYPDQKGQDMIFRTSHPALIVVNSEGPILKEFSCRRGEPEVVVHVRKLKVRDINSELNVEHYHVVALLAGPRRSSSHRPFPDCTSRQDVCTSKSADESESDRCPLLGWRWARRLGEDFKVEDLLKEMRQSRAGLVQTAHQYYYVHAVLLEYFMGVGHSRRSAPSSPLPQMTRSSCKKPMSWTRVREEWSRQDAGVFIRRTLDKGIDGLREEFNRNPRIYDTAKCTVGCRNPELNRYKDISCHDHNRVHVVGANPDEYIHANYGPMEATCADFWMMVIQEKVERILMLCEFEEQNRPRCAKYYPEQQGQQMTFQTSGQGPIVITNSEGPIVKEIKYTNTSSPDVVVDIRMLKVNGLNSEIVVKHYHWRFWPDRGAPPPFPLVIRMLEKRYSKQNPIVIHCSAGVGRIARQGFKVEDLLKEMRQSRAGLVQTVHQYYYFHAVLLEYFAKQKPYQCPLGNRQADFDKFMADYTKAVAQVDNNKSTMSYLPSSDVKKAT
ncbi:unnamed protein product, partial [Mesorhabditis spiculigera]